MTTPLPRRDTDLPAPLLEGLALAQSDHEIAVEIARDMYHLIAALGREMGLVVGRQPGSPTSYGFHFHDAHGHCMRRSTERRGLPDMAEAILQGIRAYGDQLSFLINLRAEALLTALTNVGFDLSEHLGETWGDVAVTSQDARVQMAEAALRVKIGKYMNLARTGAVEQYKREQARAAQQTTEGQPDAQANADNVDSDR